MERAKLGRSGLQVSRLCLGTMMFGGETDEAESRRIVDAAFDAGVNFIDTADVYHRGASEEVVGRLVAARRADWVLATKAGNRFDPGEPNTGGLSRRWLQRALDASLRRLGTDWIDVYYWHREDPDTALEESVSAMGDAIRAGKIRYFALSNFKAWRHAEVVRLCGELGVDKPVASQPYYNAMNRQPEVEILPACARYGMAVVPYSPAARGVLSGKYAPGEAPAAGTRAGRRDRRMMQTEFRPESLEIARDVAAHAQARGMTPVQFAVRWVLANPYVTAAIVGPRTLEQAMGYLGVFDRGWTAEDEAMIDSRVAPGHPSTHGFLDPAYPVEGRPSPA